jgi:fumarate reductase subunit D
MTLTIKNSGRGSRTVILGVLSYLGVLCFISLVNTDRDEFIYFHARQGLVLWGLSVVAGSSLLIPGVGFSIFSFLMSVVIALSLAGIIAVILRKAWKLPLVYRLSQAI